MSDRAKTFGEIVAKEIFEVGNEGFLKTYRIEFKAKLPDGREIGRGGLCLEALARVIDRVVDYQNVMKGKR